MAHVSSTSILQLRRNLQALYQASPLQTTTWSRSPWRMILGPPATHASLYRMEMQSINRLTLALRLYYRNLSDERQYAMSSNSD